MNAQAMLIEEPETAPKKRTRSVQKAELPAPSGVDGILYLATRPDLDVEKVEKLIALYNAERARLAKEEFDRNFALFQAELQPIEKTKEGDKAKYAPLEDLQIHANPGITRHGFSYTFDEERLEGGWKRVWITVNGHGHSRRSYFDVAPFESPQANSSGKNVMNVIQVEATKSSYGQRYAFKAAFALIVKGEDTDATFEQGVKYGNEVRLIRESTDLKSLSENWKAIVAGLNNDRDGKVFLYTLYEARKKELLK